MVCGFWMWIQSSSEGEVLASAGRYGKKRSDCTRCGSVEVMNDVWLWY